MLAGDDVEVAPAGIGIIVCPTSIRTGLVVRIEICWYKGRSCRSSIVRIELGREAEKVHTSEEID